MTGTLYIVATPIGNLQDISLRALSVLKAVDLIAAEDTRHSKKLLNHFYIHTSLTSFHQHSKPEKKNQLIGRLLEGHSIALISDAGTPLISDPGESLVKEAQQNKIPVVPIPGACAAITALSASGLTCEHFYFEGFLPTKTKARKERLESLANLECTLIFYEAPHRILSFMETLLSTLGTERQVVIARELTKTFETIHRAEAEALLSWLKESPKQQIGEFVILVEGYSTPVTDNLVEAERIYNLLINDNLSPSQATKLTAEITGIRKNKLYKLLV